MKEEVAACDGGFARFARVKMEMKREGISHAARRWQ